LCQSYDGQDEDRSQKIDVFLTEMAKEFVFKRTMSFLKGYKSMVANFLLFIICRKWHNKTKRHLDPISKHQLPNLARFKDEQNFKNFLKHFWFNDATGHHAFEFVFVGIKTKEGGLRLKGMHSWLRYYQLQNAGLVDYYGYDVKNKVKCMSLLRG